jgi:hypothetical protein
MKTPELIAAMAKLGFEPQFWSPPDYAAFLADEMRRWPALAAAGKGRRHRAGVGCRAIIGFSSAGHHVNRERPLGSVRFPKNGFTAFSSLRFLSQTGRIAQFCATQGVSHCLTGLGRETVRHPNLPNK